MDSQYRNCVYMSGVLRMRSLADSEVYGHPASIAMIDTDDPGAGGLHRLATQGEDGHVALLVRVPVDHA